jgi:hypothetical protein
MEERKDESCRVDKLKMLNSKDKLFFLILLAIQMEKVHNMKVMNWQQHILTTRTISATCN